MARPIEWTPERVEEAKVLYLQLLRAGKTEEEIDAVDGVPCWDYRVQWSKDKSFSGNVHDARALGAERLLIEGEKIMRNTYDRALDDAASPQLVAVTENIMKHRRWKASKYAPNLFGDRTIHAGDPENPIVVSGLSELLAAQDGTTKSVK